MKQRLYVAYGSNLNFAQMKCRCPTAKFVGVGVINDYELQFKGKPTNAFATIEPKEGASVPVGVWKILPSDEKCLDRYEGYPSHYFKEDVPVQMEDGSQVDGMVYIMNQKMQFGLPSIYYYSAVRQGYKNCGLDIRVLNEAVQKSAGMYYENTVNSYAQQLRVTEDVEDDEELDEDEEMYEEDFEDDEDMDYSGGMQL